MRVIAEGALCIICQDLAGRVSHNMRGPTRKRRRLLLTNEHELFRKDGTTTMQAVQIHAAGKTRGVE